jgi:hypothetical protein
VQVEITPKTNLLIFPPNSEPARASGSGRSDSRVVAGSSALPKVCELSLGGNINASA